MMFQALFPKNNPQVAAIISQLNLELEENQLLRLGLWGILGIMIFYWGLLISDANVTLEKEIAAAKSRENKAIHLAEETYWQERAQASKKQLADLQIKFDKAPTQGVAKATLQNLITEFTKKSQMNNVKIRVENGDDVTDPLFLWSFAATVQAEFSPQTFENFLFSLSSHPNHLLIDNLDILPYAKRFTIRIRYWFSKDSDWESIAKQNSETTKRANPPQEDPSQKDSQSISKEQAKQLGFPDEIFN